jgi:hypothetical protein
MLRGRAEGRFCCLSSFFFLSGLRLVQPHAVSACRTTAWEQTDTQHRPRFPLSPPPSPMSAFFFSHGRTLHRRRAGEDRKIGGIVGSSLEEGDHHGSAAIVAVLPPRVEFGGHGHALSLLARGRHTAHHSPLPACEGTDHSTRHYKFGTPKQQPRRVMFGRASKPNNTTACE